ncbi:MAG: hypothetical protein LBT92_03870 [Rickettsiales bacterium]|jgi:hypothetical protein|nr:hypothetical protein [Rickettsiales bacterium]
MNVHDKRECSVTDVMDEVRRSEYSWMLHILGRYNIPVRFSRSLASNAVGAYSFKRERTADGGPARVKDRAIELNPDRPYFFLIAGTLIHELQHAIDLNGEYEGAKESDRPELERRAERTQGEYLRRRCFRPLARLGAARAYAA